jgi:curved DNA-binding protein CbpA
MKDYYAILGVTPDAEDFVIKAVYRALMQRYHPDRFKGSAEEAHRMTSLINEAYDVLSNAEKKSNYDERWKSAERRKDNFSETGGSEQFNDYHNDDWAIAVRYYPDLASIDKRLKNISDSLSLSFRSIILDSKDFERREVIANELEKAFLRRYFGDNEDLNKFALRLIVDGKRDGAKELNKAIQVLGLNSDPVKIIEEIRKKYYAQEVREEEARAKEKEKEKQKEEENRSSPWDEPTFTGDPPQGSGSAAAWLFWGVIGVLVLLAVVPSFL